MINLFNISNSGFFREEKAYLKGIEEELYKRWQEIKKKILANDYHLDIDEFGYILLWMKKFLPEVIDNNEQLYDDINKFIRMIEEDEKYNYQYWHLVLPFGMAIHPYDFIPYAEANLNHGKSTIRYHVQNCLLLQEKNLNKESVAEMIRSQLASQNYGCLLEFFCASRGYKPFPDEELATLFNDNSKHHVYLGKNEEDNFIRFKNGSSDYFSFKNKYYETYAHILEDITAFLFDSSFNRAKYSIEQPSLFPSSLFTETLNERLSRSITTKPNIEIQRIKNKMLKIVE